MKLIYIIDNEAVNYSTFFLHCLKNYGKGTITINAKKYELNYTVY